MGAALELDVRRTGDKTLDVQGREGNEVVLVVFVDVEDGVTDLLDVDSSAERGLLSVVSLETDTVLLVPDAVCGDWGMVASIAVRKEARHASRVIHT